MIEQESKSEKFKRTSGIYAIKTFILGFMLILLGIVVSLFYNNRWLYLISAAGLLIVLWAVSEGNQENENENF